MSERVLTSTDLRTIQLDAFGRKPKEDDCGHKQPAVVLDESKRRGVPTKPMRFVSLHHHSTYSFLDGYQLPDAHVRRVTELNGSALAMTEHGNVMSHAKFEQAAKKDGIKPIFGMEAYCGEIDEARRTQTKNHLTLIAKTPEGYRNLLRLVSDSWMKGFYYEPTVSGELLGSRKDGLAVLSGCQGSLLFTSLVGGKHIPVADASYRRARSVAARFKQALNGNYFIEVQAFPELALTRQANPLLARIARELNIPLVATLDCHYAVPTEKEVQQALHAIRSGGKQTPEDKAKEWGYHADLSPPLTDRELWRKLVATGLTRQEAIDAILNTEALAQDINLELPKLPMVRYPLGSYENSTDMIWDWLREGWHFRGHDSLPPAVRQDYIDRVKYEMSIITEKDYVDYFLIVSDLVKFAKGADIGVGPARGSAAASLVCWLLRITEVDPMRFPHLVFERFIDITREDLPDIDLDFESNRRGEIVDYAVEKYGRECVSNIGTFQKYKSKLALDDVARIYRIPSYEVQQVKDVLLERSSGDLRASATILDTIEQFEQAKAVVEKYPQLMMATKLEGNVKGFGIHAAGVAISNGPITDVCSILHRETKKQMKQVVAIDKYDAEYLGVLKIDLLALSALDALVDMCRLVGKKPKFLYEIPLDDEKTIQGFKDNDVIGIFQYEGRAMRMVNQSIKPDDFAEICHVTALARPGPLHNGSVADYVDIKHGRKQPHLRHPALEAITAFTQFQIVYQEQILRIVREIGGFDWTHAAYIRKIISRKLGDAEFNRQWERFWEGASTIQDRSDFPPISEELAKGIWGDCTTSGSYAFNAAHSVSYGYIAYWTQWFKQNEPDAFYPPMLHRADKKSGGDSSNTKASITTRARLNPHTIMLRDALAHGYEILPLSLTDSSSSWAPGSKPKTLLPGFTQIPGIGDSMYETIQRWQGERTSPPTQWGQMIEVRGIGQKKLATIREFAETDDPFNVTKLDKLIESVRVDLERLGLPQPTHKAIEVPYERGRDTEVVWIGVGVHRNLRDIFEVNRARTGEELDRATVRHPEKNEWMLLAGYDGTDILSLRFTRFLYPRFKKMLWSLSLHSDVILAHGVKPGFRTAREVYVDKMWVLSP